MNFGDESNSTVGMIANASSSTTTMDPRYFIQPHSDPELAACTNVMLKSELQLLNTWKWWLTGLVSSSLGLAGFIGNVFAIVILSKMRSAFNLLLIALCTFDTFFLISNVIPCVSALGLTPSSFAYVERVSNVFGQVFMCASVFMIVALTLERHFAYRLRMRTTNQMKHVVMYVAPVTFLSIFLNIPLFINLKRGMMSNVMYVKVNLYLRALHPLSSTGLIPLTMLTVLNFRICRGLRFLKHRRNRKDLNLAKIAIAIVSLFLVSNVPRIVAGSMEVANTDVILRCVENNVRYIHTLLFYKIDCIARTLMIFNSSINIIIYCALSQPFKSAFLHFLSPCCFKSFLQCFNVIGSNNNHANNNGTTANPNLDVSTQDLATFASLPLRRIAANNRFGQTIDEDSDDDDNDVSSNNVDNGTNADATTALMTSSSNNCNNNHSHHQANGDARNDQRRAMVTVTTESIVEPIREAQCNGDTARPKTENFLITPMGQKLKETLVVHL